MILREHSGPHSVSATWFLMSASPLSSALHVWTEFSSAGPGHTEDWHALQRKIPECANSQNQPRYELNKNVVVVLLGGSNGVVKSLDFGLASLKSLGYLYFQCILSSQWNYWKVAQWQSDTDSELVNFMLPILKAFLEVHSQNVSGNTQYLVARAIGCPKMHFSTNLRSSGQPKNNTKALFSTLHPLSQVIFATASVVAFVLLHSSRFNFHCYTQLEATPTQKSARKWCFDLLQLLAQKITKGIHWCKPASLNCPTEVLCSIINTGRPLGFTFIIVKNLSCCLPLLFAFL